MERTLSKEARGKIGEEILLQGWVYTLRAMGNINFLILRDRNGLIQVVIADKKEFSKIKNLQPGSVLSIKGKVVKAKTDLGVEVIDPSIEVLVPIKDLPVLDISKNEIHADIETLIKHRPLALRNLKHAAIFKIQSGILEGFRKSMQKQDFIEFVSPVLMGSASESGADVFEVNYFDGKAYLAQSPQTYKQIMIGAYERTFCVAKVFRAEKHNTSRHLMEITQLDGEMGFIKTYYEVLDVIEKTIRDIVDHVKNNYPAELKLWNCTLPEIPKEGIPRIKVVDLLKIIEERTGISAKRKELDLTPEDEYEIGKYVKEKFKSDFVFALNYKKNKNFYTWNNPDDPKESLSYDLIFKGLEVLSGTHRIHLYDELRTRMQKEGLHEESYSQYLEAFKSGMPAEAGFSFGLERLTQKFLGFSNIREATLFPSDLKRIAGQPRVQEKIKNGKDMVKKIQKVIESLGLKYEIESHEPTPTSEDAARVRAVKQRNVGLKQGVKAIILKGKKTGKNIMVCLPGSEKINMGNLQKKFGERFEFENPEVIKKNYGLQIGGIPPFGNLLGLETYFDSRILEENLVAFNAGTQTETIFMSPSDLERAVNPEIIDMK